jgi:hypothetical protein
VKKIIAGVLVLIGLLSVVVSFVYTPVTICSRLNGVSTCALPNYGSLAVYLAISGAFLVGGMYILAMLRKGGKALPLGTHGTQAV